MVRKLDVAIVKVSLHGFTVNSFVLAVEWRFTIWSQQRVTHFQPTVEQVKEAAEFLLKGNHQGRRKGKAPVRLLLVGYSYGSIVAASASAGIPQVIGVISIAPPIGVRHWLFLFNGNYHLEQARKRPDLPQLLIIGDQDNFTSEGDFMAVVKSMRQESTTGAVLKGADHFFRGREKDLMDILGMYIIALSIQSQAFVSFT